MKNLCYLIMLIFLTSCPSDRWWGESLEEATQYVPILMSETTLKESVKAQTAQSIVNAGKIYIWQQYLLLVELYQGVHVIDNSDPENPSNIAFITVPGCVDIAMKQGYLYADNATDLVTIDLQNINDIKLVNRQQSVFPELLPPDLSYIPHKYTRNERLKNSVIIGWEKKR